MITREYLNASLRPLLQKLGVVSAGRELICEDVRQRLESILGNWSDVTFRNTALLLGMEEATFYEPAVVPIEMRAAVVVAVRNSMIEDLSAAKPFVPALRRFAECMPDSFVPRITREAVLFFWEKVPRTKRGWGVSPPRRKDVFRELAQEFPQSWQRLQALAFAEGQEVRMSGCSDVTEPEQERPRLRAQETEACLSGYMPELTPEEAEIFARVSSEPGMMFFTHSFKWFTRNPSKLLRGIETVVSAGGRLLRATTIFHGTIARAGYR